MKRLFSICLIIMLLATTINIYANENEHWADETFSYFIDLGIIKDGEFTKQDYDTPIARGKFVNILMRLFETTDFDNNIVYFSDVDINSEYYIATARAKLKGYIKGDENNLFRPNDAIQRQELFVIVDRAINITNCNDEGVSLLNFNDETDIDDYAKVAIKNL